MTILGQSISAKDMKSISKFFEPLTLKKGDVFIERGQKNDKIGILLHGLMIGKYISEKGLEETSKIYCLENNNNIVSDHESFRNGTQSEETIKALEETQLMVITKKVLDAICKSKPKFDKLIREAAEASYINATRRVKKFQSLNAKERVADFFIENFGLINRLSNKDIASYLGMNRNHFAKYKQEFLSER